MSKNKEAVNSNAIIKELYPDGTVKEIYREVIHRGTLYRVKENYLGKFPLQKAIEDLTVRKILADINDGKITDADIK